MNILVLVKKQQQTSNKKTKKMIRGVRICPVFLQTCPGMCLYVRVENKSPTYLPYVSQMCESHHLHLLQWNYGLLTAICK